MAPRSQLQKDVNIQVQKRFDPCVDTPRKKALHILLCPVTKVQNEEEYRGLQVEAPAMCYVSPSEEPQIPLQKMKGPEDM